MADDQSSSKVAIIVAVIGLIGVLGTAVFSNWDKLVGSRTSRTPHRITPSKPSQMGPLLQGINLQGSDFSPTPILVASPGDCSEKCNELESCVAMTFVRNPNPFGAGDCWLKNAVPSQTKNPNMASAIKMIKR